MPSWTSRRRVEAALNHREADRVPTDLTITEIPYVRLRDYLGLPREENLKANRFGEVDPALDLLAELGIDIASIKLSGPKVNIAPPPLADGTAFDEWGVGRRSIDVPGGGFLLEVTHAPFADLDPAEVDLDAYPWPDPHDPGRISGLAERARALHGEGLALMGRFGGTIMEQAFFMRGMQTWMMDLLRYPDFAAALMNRITDIQIALDEAGIRETAPLLSIFKLSGEDLGMQDRPLFSRKVWQNLLRPILARRWKAARAALDRYGGEHVKLMLHSDGAIRSFLPDLIEDRVDMIDPIQVHCAGMEFEGLKRDFGAQLSFHGAIDTQHLLPFGTPDEVRAETLRAMRELGRDGGFILAPVHNVQPDVPPENLAIMYRTVLEQGRYPLQ